VKPTSEAKNFPQYKGLQVKSEAKIDKSLGETETVR
jgi:hypothetical protein